MPEKLLPRRALLKNLILLPIGNTVNEFASTDAEISSSSERKKAFRVSLNAYSFNTPLSNGSLKIADLLQFCADTGFDAVDLTGYYFPGYPNVPPDSFIYETKHKAFSLGLSISGTGVRNDFTQPDEQKRQQDVEMVKQWIGVAAKLGAPVIRIFSGTQQPAGYTREQILRWMIDDIKTCVQCGKEHGVVVAIQNHFDFIKTPAETREIIDKVNSDWFGLILDIGSYRGPDPYAEVKEMIPYAVSWQLKETVFVNGVEEKTNIKKVVRMIKESDYRGYLPIETLGPGKPELKVADFFHKVKKALT